MGCRLLVRPCKLWCPCARVTARCGCALHLARTNQGLRTASVPLWSRQVPALCARMQSDAQRLTAALSTCRAAARAQRTGEVMASMDGAYREAERCSQWRRRVQVGAGTGQQP